jgi:tRNA 2-selenouridine synthase SelU
LPDSIFRKITEGPAVLVESSLEARTRRITDDYLGSSISRELALQDSLLMLDTLKKTLGKNCAEEISALVQEGNIRKAVAILLAEYYDPLYGRSIKNKQFELTVCSDDTRVVALKLAGWVQSRSAVKL